MTLMSRTGELVTGADITMAVEFGQRDGMMGQKNEDAWRSFASERSEVLMIVEHDVMVRRGGRGNVSRNHVSDDVQTWRRTVTLLDVAAYSIQSICVFE